MAKGGDGGKSYKGSNEKLRASAGHPCLRGGNPPLPHRFTPGQMRALSALCATFVPSLPLEASGLSNVDGGAEIAKEVLAKTRLDDVDKFYRLSASEADFPLEVAGHVCAVLKPKDLNVMAWVLWLMTTRLGTFLLFGTSGLSWEFPIVQSFLTLSLESREKALRSWSTSSIKIYQLLFKLFKVYILFCFYAKVDENGANPCWNAIGYCGPDPERKTATSTKKPLEGKVIDWENSKESIGSLLADGGFTVLDDCSHLRTKARSQSKRKEIGIKCDAVVVGSGSGGGVIAGVVAKAGYKVLVLEKGQYYARDDLTLLEGPSYKAMYEGAGTTATDDGNVNLLAATTVGGGSAVNWAASLQTPQHVRQEWAEKHGLSLFATEKYQEAMDAVCARGSVRAICERESFQNQILADGCKSLGYETCQIPRNARSQHSCGWCCFGCKNGEKQSTSETWLLDAVNSGAFIISNCRAEEVLHEEKHGKKSRKARGVVATCGDGNTFAIYVEAAITVVSCGSLNTPPLLLKSGLRNENIGRNLYVHPSIVAWGYFPDGQKPAGTCYEGAIMTSLSREAANWNSSGYGALLEVAIMHPGSWAALNPWRSGSEHKAAMRRYARTANVLVLTRDKVGSGRVRLDSRGKRSTITYHVSPHDEGSAMDGLEKGLRALAAAGAEEVGTQRSDGETFSFSTSSSATSEKFEAYLKRTVERGLGGFRYPVNSAHQMGSCRMGVSKEVSVVDESGETWEVEGLFLGDASVFPTSSGVNPMITVQSIAYCTAQHIIVRLQNHSHQQI